MHFCFTFELGYPTSTLIPPNVFVHFLCPDFVCPEKVNSPGPAAGAYWLARRQSYRVKMAIPVHEQYGHGEDGRQQVSNRAPSSTSRHPARRRTRQWFKGATSARPTTSTAVTGRRVAPGNICKGAGVTSHSRRKGKGSSASRIRTEGGKGFFPLYEPRSLGKG